MTRSAYRQLQVNKSDTNDSNKYDVCEKIMAIYASNSWSSVYKLLNWFKIDQNWYLPLMYVTLFFVSSTVAQ